LLNFEDNMTSDCVWISKVGPRDGLPKGWAHV
jgi:hypothetical protein